MRKWFTSENIEVSVSVYSFGFFSNILQIESRADVRRSRGKTLLTSFLHVVFLVSIGVFWALLIRFLDFCIVL